jgi:hypothetical protein
LHLHFSAGAGVEGQVDKADGTKWGPSDRCGGTIGAVTAEAFPPGRAGAGSVTGRDRGPDGRARNARPRDVLGRPLPYGSVDVPRQPEGIRRSPQGTLDEAQRLLDAGFPFPFHAHEVFEDAWKIAPAG